MCVVGARQRMMMCDCIVVVSQFLGEYFHPYPETLHFKGEGEGEDGRVWYKIEMGLGLSVNGT